MAEQYWYPGSGLGEADFTGGPTTAGWQPHLFCYGNTITVGGSAGTATVISARVDTGNEAALTMKAGLYDSSGNLQAQGTVAVPQGAAGTWRDVSISVAVSPGTYRVLVSGSTTNLRIYYNTGDDGDTSTTDYADAMADPETISVGTEPNLGYAVRVYVVESAGGVKDIIGTGIIPFAR